VQYGPTSDVVAAYMQTVSQNTASATLPPDAEKPMRLRHVQVTGQSSNNTGMIDVSEQITVTVEYDINRPLSGVHVFCYVYNMEGVCVLGTGDADIQQENLGARPTGAYRSQFHLPAHLLAHGAYALTITLGVPYVIAYDRHESIVQFEIVPLSSEQDQYLSKRRPGIIGFDIPWQVEQITC
jgi:hypothetical protein